MHHPPGRIGVVGLGSVLMGDDAVGPYFVRAFEQAYAVPSGVSILDAGTPGPGLIDHIRDFEALIVVDSVAGGNPGELRCYRRPEILAPADSPPSLRTSPHEPGLREALATCALAGVGPTDVLLVGVVTGKVELGTGLSPAVQAALPEVERTVLEELARLGVSVERRPVSGPPDVWWER